VLPNGPDEREPVIYFAPVQLIIPRPQHNQVSTGVMGQDVRIHLQAIQ
jgi:hypothetical protein